MPFEPKSPGVLDGSLGVTLTGGGVAPSNIVHITKATPDTWGIQVNFEMHGTVAAMYRVAGATFHVTSALESIGPGGEFVVLNDAHVPAMACAWDGTKLSFSHQYNIGPAISPLPGVGVYRLATRVTYTDASGAHQPVAAYQEGPEIFFY